MNDPRPRFNLRLTPELEALLNEASRKSGRSKNAEILKALDMRFARDDAVELAEALRPLIEQLTPAQRETFVDLVRTMAKGAARGRRRKADHGKEAD